MIFQSDMTEEDRIIHMREHLEQKEKKDRWTFDKSLPYTNSCGCLLYFDPRLYQTMKLPGLFYLITSALSNSNKILTNQSNMLVNLWRYY